MDIEKRIKELHDAYGGKEAFNNVYTTRSEEMEHAWGSDIICIGLVLRSHLFVEYYLNKFLKNATQLSEQQIHQLTFYKKVQHLKDTKLIGLVVSLEKFNQVRNKLSHNINATVEKDDILPLLEYEGFQNHYFVLQIDAKKVEHVYQTYAKLVGQKITEALDPHYHIQEKLMEDATKEFVRIYRGGE
ncbi:hypothetical protein [Vibrio owensii]|uniref:hypothetical protein n=1 Tax=Vibrio owensii TaxID=696485 RepID=UPI000694CC70|nr:hypothetical protein [Vibrio owensii]